MKQLASLLLLATTLAAPALAQRGTADVPAARTLAAASAPAYYTEGEVRKVDKEAKKLTIKHGPLKNLDMPAMTMVFQVKDGSWLDALKAGDRIRFVAEKTSAGYVVTELGPMP